MDFFLREDEEGRRCYFPPGLRRRGFVVDGRTERKLGRLYAAYIAVIWIGMIVSLVVRHVIWYLGFAVIASLVFDAMIQLLLRNAEKVQAPRRRLPFSGRLGPFIATFLMVFSFVFLGMRVVVAAELRCRFSSLAWLSFAAVLFYLSCWMVWRGRMIHRHHGQEGTDRPPNAAPSFRRHRPSFMDIAFQLGDDGTLAFFPRGRDHAGFNVNERQRRKLRLSLALVLFVILVGLPLGFLVGREAGELIVSILVLGAYQVAMTLLLHKAERVPPKPLAGEAAKRLSRFNETLARARLRVVLFLIGLSAGAILFADAVIMMIGSQERCVGLALLCLGLPLLYAGSAGLAKDFHF